MRYEQMVRIHMIPTMAAPVPASPRPVADGRIHLAKLSAQQVQALYSTKLREGLAQTTARHLHMALHGALESASRTKWLSPPTMKRLPGVSGGS
jgi:hypothetical protein